ncbi:MAG: HD domain-containing protein [Eubacterium coprostanoligenes]|uniref:deoxyguanosinetriphosphate triphosphohydrolase family protein n=1 Tax=Eubacterium coprostanoligenes TaxID=290054 RepID=UPI00235355F9|nr:HD domain-containing protein [Eubacterium coprostanoligenes]MCI7264229.1 HD domain-containing protein [Eubacterium coprostanoligenes]
MADALKYNKINEELQQKIKDDRENHWVNPYAFKDENAVRRNNDIDKANLWRPVFVRDTEKIMHLPYYNRYADKTQVFSFKNNDDITRRAQHVQLVSRVARNIGSVLGLNLDLIEAIALGHDIGHTPFGHAGERFLSELYHNETGRYFNHNVHSTRVFDKIFARNFTMQTLDGVLCHNGEFEQQEYRPNYTKTFDEYDAEVEDCYTEGASAIKRLIPSTLEGCVVRICDMIAYLGKDRQDAVLAGIIDPDYQFKTELIGTENAKIINNLTVDIIEHSYGKDYIMLSDKAFKDLSTAKKENYEVIYNNDVMNQQYEEIIKPMFEELYYKLLDDVNINDTDSIIFKHHINPIGDALKQYHGIDYSKEEKNQIVVDYIASMTDDYFIDLHKHMFPDSKYKVEYEPYF